MRSPFLTYLSIGFAALLAALSTPSLTPNQATHAFKPPKSFTLSPDRAVSTRQSTNRSVIAAAAFKVTDRTFSMIGTPYRWGGTTPKKDFNCSGLVNYVFQDVGDVDLPRTARAIYNVDSNKVSRGKLRPGDLVLFQIRSRDVDHVDIYVGSDRFVHALWRGKKTRVSGLSSSCWKRHYLAGKRILPITLAQVESTRKR